MVKTATRSVDLEPIDRLEEKMKLLVGMLDPLYVAKLATYVDEKIRAAADTTPTGDSLRLAVLAALNIADELFRCRDVTQARAGELAERAGELERLLDRVLMAS